jgi:hypothetical protein
MNVKSNPLRKLLPLVAGVLALAAPPVAYAVPTLQLTDGVTTVTIEDMSGSDFNPTVGAVTFIGSVGNFSLNGTTGISKPVLGSATLPSLDLSSVEVSGPSGGGTLTIRFSDDFFGPTLGGVTASIGGTTPIGGTVLYSTFADASNVPFGTSTLLTTQGPFGGPAFSGTTFANLGLLSFSLTQEVVISHSSPGLVTSFNAELKAVPDGGSTVAFLGAVLVGLESFRRRFRVS